MSKKHVGGSVTPINAFSRQRLHSPNAYLQVDSDKVTLDAFGLRSRGPLIFEKDVTELTWQRKRYGNFVGLRDQNIPSWYWFQFSSADELELKSEIGKVGFCVVNYEMSRSDLALLTLRGALTSLVVGLILTLSVVLFGNFVDQASAENLPPSRPVGSVSFALGGLGIGVFFFGLYQSSIYLISYARSKK